MAALTAYVDRRFRPGGFSWPQNWVVNNADVIFIGSFVGLPNPSSGGLTAKRGFVVPFSVQQNLMWVGVCVRTNYESTTDQAANKVTGVSAGTPPPEAWTEGGPVVLEQYAVTGLSAQSDMGKAVFATSDNDLTLTQPNVPSIGRVCYWYSASSADVLTYGFLGLFASQTVV